MACEGCDKRILALEMDREKTEQRLIALEKDSEKNQATHKEFFKRFEESGITDARTDEKYANILIAISDLKAQVRELADKPRKHWETLIASGITAIVSGVIVFFIK